MSAKKGKRPEGRVYRERPTPEKGARDKPVLALLKVDEDGHDSEEEIGRFIRALGLPENND